MGTAYSFGVQQTGAYVQLTTTGATFTVPGNVTSIRVRVRGGGGQGGGGGSAATSATAQAGGGGGGAGEVKDEEVSVTPGDVLTATIGAGGSAAGAGGAAGGNNGSNGSNGGNTSLATSGVPLIVAEGGGFGLGSAARSTTAVASGSYASADHTGRAGTAGYEFPGNGGPSGLFPGTPLAGVVGGSGGGAATITGTGGGSGPASTVANNALVVAPATPTAGGSANLNGVNGTTATTPGCGGGGGGGGLGTTGTGGNGGNGAPGLIEIWY